MIDFLPRSPYFNIGANVPAVIFPLMLAEKKIYTKRTHKMTVFAIEATVAQGIGKKR